jgi:hypothetical protein
VALATPLQAIEEDFARERLEQGARALGAWLEQLPSAWFHPAGETIRSEVACKLQQHGYSRPEYVLLGLHALIEGLAE